MPEALVLGLILLLALAAFLLWRRQPMVPNITFAVLPPYEIPDVVVVGAVLVENRGRATAHNVRVEVEYDPLDWAQIHHMRIVCAGDYVLRSGGEQSSHANLRLRSMRPGEQVLLYMAGPRPVTPRVKVTLPSPAPADRSAGQPSIVRLPGAAPADSLPSAPVPATSPPPEAAGERR